MNNHTCNSIGVDISKAHLDVHRLASGDTAQFDNDDAGFQALSEWIGSSVDVVVYESTGPWHRAFEEALAPGLPLARVNALRARRFAQAMGQHAKTDAVDARVLAEMGATMTLRLVAVPSQALRELDELQSARDALIKERTAALNRRQQVRHKLLKKQLKQRIEQSNRQLRALDNAIREGIASDAQLARKCEVLTSMPGIAAVTAAGLLTEIPELGRIDSKSVASLAGLAPMTRESGQWQGRSCVRGGRARPRRMLYMAALTAMRHNPDLARKYAHLRARGKPFKVALTAIMRKLIVLANALLKQDRLWTPTPVSTHA